MVLTVVDSYVSKHSDLKESPHRDWNIGKHAILITAHAQESSHGC